MHEAAQLTALLEPATMMAINAFEGSEKRLELDCAVSAHTPAAGLRSLTREQLETVLTEVGQFICAPVHLIRISLSNVIDQVCP